MQSRVLWLTLLGGFPVTCSPITQSKSQPSPGNCRIHWVKLVNRVVADPWTSQHFRDVSLQNYHSRIWNIEESNYMVKCIFEWRSTSGEFLENKFPVLRHFFKLGLLREITRIWDSVLDIDDNFSTSVFTGVYKINFEFKSKRSHRIFSTYIVCK